VNRHAKASSAGSTSGMRAASVTALLLCALAAFALLAAQASAATRVFVERFGPDGTSATSFGQPFQMAFNQSAKKLYVLDPNTSVKKIYAFNMSTPGHPVAEGSPFPITMPQTSTADGLAVDNTALASAGNLYFLSNTASDRKLYGFSASGAPLGGNFPITLNPSANIYGGAAVDGAGNVWINDKTAKKAREFTSAGVELTGAGHEISTAALGENPRWIAFDAADNAYINFLTAPSATYKCTAVSGYASCSVFSSLSTLTKGLAVNTTTGRVFLSRESSPKLIEEFEPAGGTAIFKFGEASLSGIPSCSTNNQVYNGLATNNATDEIYATEQTCLKQVVVFSPYGSAPAVTLNSASGLTGTHAALSGTVNPEGAPITECKFEYGLTASYGQSAPCTGSIPTDSSPHAVSAALTNLAPQGTTYHYRIVAKNAIAPGISADKTFTTPNTFATTAASGLTNTAATLNGTVNPDGVAITECKFEYGPTTLYGSSVPCSPEAGAIPNDAATHAVSAALSGLTPNASYHYRLVVADGLGTFKAADQSFQLLGPPQVSAQAAVSEEGGAILSSYVNPSGANTSYFYEFGEDTSYGDRAPADFSFFIGSGTLPVQGSMKVSGLSPDTTYHYRVNATSEYGTTHGPDQTFTTAKPNAACANGQLRTEQTSSSYPDGTVELPECMALEMVTPPKKYNQNAGGPALSLNGDTIRYLSLAALADTPQLGSFADPYVAMRGPTGWVTHSARPRPELSTLLGTIGAPCAFSSDLTRWTGLGALDDQRESGFGFAFSGNVAGAFSKISPSLLPSNVGFNPTALNFAECQGGTADGSEMAFSVPGINYLPNDPPVPASGTSPQLDSPNAYLARLDEDGNPTLELLARDSAGAAYGGACGASVGAKGGSAYRGTISPDGSRVYFTTRPVQPEGVLCEISGARNFLNKQRIMKRLQTPSGPQISQVESSECTRVSPPCNTANGDDKYVGASQEGGIVYFTTTRQLADTDLDTGIECGREVGKSTGCDLYLHDDSLPVGHQLIQVSAGDNTDPTPGSGAEVLGVADMAGDGSHIYFVATGLLTTMPNGTGKNPEAGKPNLYAYERDAKYPSGHTAFIGTLSSADGAKETGGGGTWGKGGPGVNSAQAVPLLGSNPEDLSVGGDGHILVFTTTAALAADDTDGGFADAYRYDAQTGSLQRISRAAPGGSDNGPFDVESEELRTGAEPLPQGVSFARWVSEDGRTVLLATKEAFSPMDTDSKLNAYLWRDGQITQLAGSTSGQNTGLSNLHPTLSTSGKEVAFVSVVALLPQDGDTSRDVYVARTDGGFPIPVEPNTCSGEACQGQTQSPPGAPALPSQSANGQGNVKSAPAAKPKKQHKKKHKHKKTRHDRHAKKNRRAAK